MLCILSVKKPSLNFLDGPSQNILTIVHNHVWAFFASVKFDQLLLLIDREGNVVMFNVLLRRCQIRLTLRGILSVLVFEFLEILQGCCICFWRLSETQVSVSLQHTAFSETNQLRIIVNCMKSSNNAACIIQSPVLLHVEVDLRSWVSSL